MSVIVSEIYPQELLDLFPDTQVDTGTAKSWFIDTRSLGANAASKTTSAFCQIKTAAGITKAPTSSKKTKASKPQESVTADNGVNSASVPSISAVNENTSIMPTIAASPTPSVHINF